MSLYFSYEHFYIFAHSLKSNMKRIISISLLLFLSIVLTAQIGGTYTYAFLSLPNSAKISALGGSNVSLRENSIMINNPAVMDSTFARNTSVSYVNYFAGVNWGFTTYNFESNKYGNFAAAIQYVNYGKFTAADEEGNITGKFYAADYIFTALWSYQIDSFWSVGAALKPLFSKYEIYSSFGIAMDFGASYVSSDKNFSAGLVFKNLGTQIKPYTPQNYEKIPFDIQLGISQKLEHAPFRLSVVLHHINKPNLGYTKPETTNYLIETQEQSKIAKIADLTMRHFIFGVEFLPSKNFYVALGYNFQRRQELKLETVAGLTAFSAGFGIKLKKFDFNYSLAKYHMAGSSNSFTISFNINNLLYNGRKNL